MLKYFFFNFEGPNARNVSIAAGGQTEFAKDEEHVHHDGRLVKELPQWATRRNGACQCKKA